MGAIADLLLVAKLAWDGKEAEEGMGGAGDSAEKMESRMGKALKKVGTALAAAFTVDKIIDFGKQCIASGAEVSAETAAFSQIMGDYAGEATKKMGDVAKSAGMVDSRLTPYMTSMTAKFKGLGYGVEDATDMAARGLTLATDASAFWDKSLDESMGHLNSFINGSYEGGEAIGLFANDTQMAAYAVEKGIVADTKAWASLDEATKQATRLEYAENMMKQSGATGQAAKESGAYANVMANLAEKWRQFQALIGEPLIEYVVVPAVNLLSKGIDYLSKAVDYVKGHFSEWKPYIEGAAIALGILGAAVAGFQIGTLIGNVAKFVSGLSLATIKTKAMAAAQAALNFVMNLNPISLIVMAIAGLVAAFVVAYNKSETFRNFVNKLWASIKNFLQPAFEAVSSFITGTVVPALSQLGSWLSDKIGGAIKAVVGWIIGTLVPTFKSWGDYVSTNIIPALQELRAAIMGKLRPVFRAISSFVTNTVVPAFKSIIDTIRNILTASAPILGAIKIAFTTVWNNIKTVLSTVWSNIKTIVSTGLLVIKGIITAVTALIKGDWSGAWNAIKGVASTIWNGIKTVIGTSISGLRTIISNTLQGIKIAALLAWNGLKAGASAAWNGIKNTASIVWNGIKSAISGPITAARTALSNVWSSILLKCSAVWNGIKTTASTVWNGIKSAVTSPITAARTALSNTMQTIKVACSLAWNSIKTTATSIWESIKTSITDKITSAKDTVSDIIGKIKGFFDFTFSWPSIPMPHFSITPDGWKVGDLLKGSIPKLGIEWYAKAMDEASVLDGATIFGAADGRLLGGGEAGREVVSGEEHLIGLINQAVAQNNAAMLAVLREILEAIRGASEELYDTIVEALTDGVRFKLNDREFGRLVRAHA